MASRVSSKQTGMAVVAVAISAALFFFGDSLNPIWPLLWFAPLPLLLYAQRASWWATAISAWLALMLGSLALWRYAHLIPFPWFASFAPMAVLFALAVLLFRALVRRGAYWTALIAFPALWVSGFYLQSLTSPSGTAGSLAYTQLKFLPMLQLAALTGPWGISFLLLLFPAALALAWHLWSLEPVRARKVLAASLGLIVAVLIFGTIRLALATPPQRLRVGLMASDLPANNGVATAGADAERLINAYVAHAAPLAQQGAQVVVMPEKIATYSTTDASAIDASLQSLADQRQVMVIAGFVTVAAGRKYNQARLYAPGVPVRTYDKEHLLPFIKGFTLGTQLLVLPGKSAPMGVEICKDMDFTGLARRYGQRKIGLMLDPAWDFTIDNTFHGHIAIMRSLEDGFNLVHAAKDGWLTVSDTRGRILAQTHSSAAPFATLVADVPVNHAATLYSLLGDWFAWLALALLAFALVQLILRHHPLAATWRGDERVPAAVAPLASQPRRGGE